MLLYTRLEGRYYALSGYMRYWTGDYDRAETLGRQALRMFEEPENNWTYQSSRQHLARPLIAGARYDEAHELLQDGAELSCLQGPQDRARNALAFSELYFSLGDEERGREHAERALGLCRHFGLEGQQRILTRSLARFSFST